MQLKHLCELADVSGVKQFFLIGLVLWTALVGVLSVAAFYYQQDVARKFARLEAVASFEKDLDYHHWAAGHGGIYVPPNPYPAHVAERDIATKSGRALMLVNPTYMMRQAHEIGKERRRIQGRITSLKPLRLENAPDAWESEALKAVERGMPEISEVVTIDGSKQMRVMRPLPAEEICQKCHVHQGYEIGDILGGISTSVPMERYLAIAKREASHFFFGLAAIWFFGVAGLVISSQGLVRSIRERGTAEDQLREREEQYRVLIEHAPEGIVVFDVDADRVVEANPKILQMLECSKEELMQGYPKRFFASNQPDGLPFEMSTAAHISRALQGEVVTFERIIRNVHGKEIYCEGHLVRLPTANRRLIRVSYIDITERKRLEQETRKLQKLEAVGMLAGGIAHDFNNMLTGAMGYMELAKMKTGAEAPGYRYLQQVEKVLEESRELGQRLLIFSKGGDPIKKPVQMQALLKDAVERTLRANPGITCELACPDTLPLVEGDEGQIYQIIRNLLLNAQEAMPEGGRISIACEEISVGADSQLALSPGDYVRVSVTDEGDGIAEEHLGKIFDPYYTTKDNYSQRGIGLGLAICHAILKKHQGLIIAHSKPGIGMTFHFYLPVTHKQT